MVFSLGGAAVFGAAIMWTPLPHGLFGEDDAAPLLPRTAAPAIVTPAAIQASRAASLIGFAPESSGAAAAPKPAPPVLVGVIGSAPRRIAYVLYAGQTVRAGLWDKVGPWRVTAIGPHGATLSGGRKPMALAFYGPRPQPPAVQPQAAPAIDEAVPTTATAPSAPVAPPRSHALEPASAPPPRSAHDGRPRYWAGPPGSAPPGYVVLKPGQAPP